MGKSSGFQKLKCVRLIGLLSAFGFVFLMIMIHGEDKTLTANKDLLISLCKKIETRNKQENKISLWHDLDNMNVNIYRENSYIVVRFLPKQTPGIFRTGRDVAYYFVKKEGRDYQYIKAVLGQ